MFLTWQRPAKNWEILMSFISGLRVRLATVLLSAVGITGCGAVGSNFSSTVVPASSSIHTVIHGSLFGGQQPVAGATIQLYAVTEPTSGGSYGSGAVPLITGPLPVSAADGSFIITGDYIPPTSASHFYIVANGGSPGVGMPANSHIALMAVLEGCNPSTILSPTLFININEVTTMAAVIGLSPFMAPPSALNTNAPNVGAPATAYSSLQNGFATAFNLANINTGTSLNHAADYATTDNNALLINAMANSLAYCINSIPANGQCANLGTATTPSGATFVANDTIQAAWYIAQNPTNNVTNIFNLASAESPFIGPAAAPSSFATPVSTSPSACQSPINLGTAANYAILAGSTITNSSTTTDQTDIINGLIGVSPGTAETGFTTGTYIGTIDNTDAAAAQGYLTAAYTTAAGLPSAAVLPTDLSGITFTPGLYSTASTVTLNSGSVTLDAQGDPDAVFIFQIGSTFTAAGGTQVLLINGANAKNVFWKVGSSATINGTAAWAGNILAYASISFGTDATLTGRALAQNAAVTLLSNKITVPQ
jgi:hypothetical protein